MRRGDHVESRKGLSALINCRLRRSQRAMVDVLDCLVENEAFGGAIFIKRGGASSESQDIDGLSVEGDRVERRFGTVCRVVQMGELLVDGGG